MIKKSVSLTLTAILTMGLAACNNDRNDINDRNRVSLDTNNRNNGIFNVRNGRDDGIDHNGPLTEDYTNNDNNDPDFDANLFNDNRKIRRTNDDTVSAYFTNLDSDQYPHTRAVLIRDAKYQFARLDPSQGNWFQTGVIEQAQPFLQGPNVNVPTPAPAPAPKQTQPVPAPAPAPTPAPKQTQPAPAPAPAPAPKQTTPAPQPKAPAKSTAPTTGTVGQYAQQVIDLTNAQRSKNGLPALKADAQLSSVAQKKALDMQQNHYFSHTSPTYGSPFDMMRDFGVTYKSAGENIAQGQRTPQEVVNAWMNSEGHRKNILSPNFTHIGVGFEETGKHWSQMFIGK